MDMKKLNLGCGNDIKENWVNLDTHKLSGVDVVHDVEKLPLPFNEGEFEEILCQDILEHAENYPVLLGDLHRILRPGGKISIRVPHFTSRNNYVDPTHRRLFSVRTFDFFVSDSRINTEKGRTYYFDFHFTKIASAKIIFEKHMILIRTINKYLIEPLVNSSRGMQDFFETTGFARFFPAQNLEIELIK